jgi:FtsP/CotA-like multicopper oxidase with cupredoxin domain
MRRAALLFTLVVSLSGPGCAPAETDSALPPPVGSPPEALDLDPDPTRLHVALTPAPRSLRIGTLDVDGYAYNGLVPGPTLRARVGDTITIDLDNQLPAPTTLHFHGMAVPYAMDGATWQTEAIPGGSQFTYSFTADHPGTFWYHPHFDTAGQVDRGLYGVIVVEDPAEPPLRERILVFDAWDEASAPAASGGHGHETPLPSLWTVNGLLRPRLDVPTGEVVRARLLNASNHGYLSLAWPGMVVIAGDQGLGAGALGPQRWLLAPGDRAEVLFRVGHELLPVSTHPYGVAGDATSPAPESDGPPLGDKVPAEGPRDSLLFTLAPRGAGSAAPWPELPFSGQAPSADPGTTDIVYVLSGDGSEDTWLINGESYPNVTPEVLSLGTEALVEVRNLSATEHPFHVHGHAFEVLSVDGRAPLFRTVEDTLNVGIRQTVRLRLVADNPGDWMVHCHILEHAHAMMTVLRVTP